jgi:hypothetical protein
MVDDGGANLLAETGDAIRQDHDPLLLGDAGGAIHPGEGTLARGGDMVVWNVGIQGRCRLFVARNDAHPNAYKDSRLYIVLLCLRDSDS